MDISKGCVPSEGIPFIFSTGVRLISFKVCSLLYTSASDFLCFGRTYKVTPASRFCPRFMLCRFIHFFPVAGFSTFSVAMKPPP